MSKKKHLGLDSGKSSNTWFTPSSTPHPTTPATGRTGGPIVRGIKMIFRDPSGKKIK